MAQYVIYTNIRRPINAQFAWGLGENKYLALYALTAFHQLLLPRIMFAEHTLERAYVKWQGKFDGFWDDISLEVFSFIRV